MKQEKNIAQKVSEKAAETTQEVQARAQQAAQKAQASAEKVTDKAQAKVSELTEQAVQKAGDVKERVKAGAESAYDEQKENAAEQVEGVASALRQSGQELRGREQEMFADYADMAADQVEQFSGYVRSKGLSDILDDVQHLARRQPELFVAGTLAAGFLLGRFLKSSQNSSQRYQSPNDGRARRAYEGYYEDRQRTYEEGRYRPGPAATSADFSPRREFQGGATENDGERSMPASSRGAQYVDPDATGADWGVDYTANEFGQSTPDPDGMTKPQKEEK